MEGWGGLLIVLGLWAELCTYQASEVMVKQHAPESAQTHAVSATQFLNFCTLKRFEVVLVDVMTPVMDGIPLCVAGER
jgi:CheY-like chemotaxis protein